MYFAFMSNLTQNTYRFADIPWLSPAGQVHSSLTSRGYSYSRQLDDGTLIFSGQILNRTSNIFCVFDPNDQLVKILVVSTPSTYKEIQEYRDARDTLIKKYGFPKHNLEYFEDPYYDGDGYERSAIQMNKATFQATWSNLQDDSLSVALDTDLDIAFAYESRYWSQEVDRRKLNSASDL
jgi:hypothetical protein